MILLVKQQKNIIKNNNFEYTNPLHYGNCDDEIVYETELYAN